MEQTFRGGLLRENGRCLQIGAGGALRGLLLAEHLDDQALAAPAVELTVEHLLPRT